MPQPHMFRFRRIHHLIRYFLFFGILAFIAYSQRFLYPLALFFIGPSVYLAYNLKKIISEHIWSLPSSDTLNYYAFLLPISLVYFGLVGFQFKQLWNERGKVKTFGLIAFAGFLAYIHYLCWSDLLHYFQTD